MYTNFQIDETSTVDIDDKIEQYSVAFGSRDLCSEGGRVHGGTCNKMTKILATLIRIESVYVYIHC